MEMMHGHNVKHTVFLAPLTEEELNAVTIVFHQYETGLREGCIFTKDLLEALHSLGISPTEQEVVDMQCEVERKGRIFFPDFCKLCLRKFREFDEENFRQELFKVICGTEPHPVRFRAKKYKVQEKSFSLVEFRNMMSHLPEHVSDTEIEEMFSYADKDNDGKISWEEFLIMITPVGMQESALTISAKKLSSNDADKITSEIPQIEQLVDTKQGEDTSKLDINKEINITTKREDDHEEEKEKGAVSVEIMQ